MDRDFQSLRVPCASNKKRKRRKRVVRFIPSPQNINRSLPAPNVAKSSTPFRMRQPKVPRCQLLIFHMSILRSLSLRFLRHRKLLSSRQRSTPAHRAQRHLFN